MFADNNVALLGRLMRKTMGDAPAFKPCAYVDGLGSLVLHTKDCSTSYEPLRGSRWISLIRDTHTNKLVGLEIAHAHKFLPAKLIRWLSHP